MDKYDEIFGAINRALTILFDRHDRKRWECAVDNAWFAMYAEAQARKQFGITRDEMESD